MFPLQGYLPQVQSGHSGKGLSRKENTGFEGFVWSTSTPNISKETLACMYQSRMRWRIDLQAPLPEFLVQDVHLYSGIDGPRNIPLESYLKEIYHSDLSSPEPQSSSGQFWISTSLRNSLRDMLGSYVNSLCLSSLVHSMQMVTVTYKVHYFCSHFLARGKPSWRCACFLSPSCHPVLWFAFWSPMDHIVRMTSQMRQDFHDFFLDDHWGTKVGALQNFL